MKLGLGAVKVNVGLPNVLALNVPLWNAHVIGVYRPPSIWLVKMWLLSQLLVGVCIDKDIIVDGEFNLPNLHWNEMGELSVGYVPPLDRSFYEVFFENGLTQLAGDSPTCFQGIYWIQSMSLILKLWIIWRFSLRFLFANTGQLWWKFFEMFDVLINQRLCKLTGFGVKGAIMECVRNGSR